jgi:hypothetical protein
MFLLLVAKGNARIALIAETHAGRIATFSAISAISRAAAENWPLRAGIRMPAIFLASCDLMRPFPSEPMRTWPISTRVNKPENDDPSIVEPVELASGAP